MFILHITKSLVLKDKDNNIIELSIESRNLNKITIDKITKNKITATYSGKWYEPLSTEEYYIADFVKKLNSDMLSDFDGFGEIKDYKLKNFYVLYSPHTNKYYMLGNSIHLKSVLYNIKGFFTFISVERGLSGTHIIFKNDMDKYVTLTNENFTISKSTVDIEHIPFYDDYIDII